MTNSSPKQLFENWYSNLKKVKANDGPANGTIAAALVLLDRLMESFDLEFEAHIAKGGAQIKGASGSRVKTILARFGETRKFASEGGRTNRGGQGDLRPLFESWKQLDWDAISHGERNELLKELQGFLVERIRDFHNRQKINLNFTHQIPTRLIFRNLLEIATAAGKSGAVAQHLVGAKLQLRFPNETITNERTTSADLQTNRQGDFQIGETVFHVTMSPMSAVYGKCNQNILEGFLVYLIVPQDKLAAARENAIEFCNGQVAVEALESFVAQNLDEMGDFRVDGFRSSLTKLIELYNVRVNQVELDKSIMIELPKNLKKKGE